jgi:hypothetical protein
MYVPGHLAVFTKELHDPPPSTTLIREEKMFFAGGAYQGIRDRSKKRF